MSRHAAKASFETRIVEGAFNALFGANTPDRDGRHRSEPKPSTWSAVKVRLLSEPVECHLCKDVERAQKKVAA